MSRDARRTRELDILRELCEGQLEGDARDRLEVVLRQAGGDAGALGAVAHVGVDDRAAEQDLLARDAARGSAEPPRGRSRSGIIASRMTTSGSTRSIASRAAAAPSASPETTTSSGASSTIARSSSRTDSWSSTIISRTGMAAIIAYDAPAVEGHRLRRHARARRPDHRCRPRRSARRPGGGSRGRDGGDHVQGPPRPLALQRGGRRHQRGPEPGRLVGVARLRHRQGLRLPRRPGRDRDHVPRGARRGALARALRRHLPPQRDRAPRHARLRRRLGRPHLLRGRHHRPGAAARALRAADEAPRADRPLRGVVRHRARPGRRAASAAAPSRATSATARWSCSPPRRRSRPRAAPASASSRPPTRSSAPATGSPRATASAPR